MFSWFNNNNWFNTSRDFLHKNFFGEPTTPKAQTPPATAPTPAPTAVPTPGAMAEPIAAPVPAPDKAPVPVLCHIVLESESAIITSLQSYHRYRTSTTKFLACRYR